MSAPVARTGPYGVPADRWNEAIDNLADAIEEFPTENVTVEDMDAIAAWLRRFKDPRRRHRRGPALHLVTT